MPRVSAQRCQRSLVPGDSLGHQLRRDPWADSPCAPCGSSLHVRMQTDAAQLALPAHGPSFFPVVFAFSTFAQKESPGLPHRPRCCRGQGGPTRTYGAAPLVAHLELLDLPHTGLAPVLGLGAVADTCPLPDAPGTGDRAGGPRGPGAPPAVNCRARAGTASGSAGLPVGAGRTAQQPRVSDVAGEIGRKPFHGPRPGVGGMDGISVVCFYLWEEKSHHLGV